MNGHLINTERIAAVYKALGSLGKEVVFVGGATVSLYANRAAAEEVRPTIDVDIVVASAAYKDYAALEEAIRGRGFINDQQSGIICRYLLDGLAVDIMPSEGSFLGFQNRWYAEGATNSMSYILPGGVVIQIFTAPYFLASKWEAFEDRGKGNGLMSTDFEDIVYVLNNRTNIWQECAGAPASVKEYLREKFASLLHNMYVEEWLSVHLEYSFAEEQARKILSNIRAFV